MLCQQGSWEKAESQLRSILFAHKLSKRKDVTKRDVNNGKWFFQTEWQVQWTAPSYFSCCFHFDFQDQYYAVNSYKKQTKFVEFVLEYRLIYHSNLESWSNFGWRDQWRSPGPTPAQNKTKLEQVAHSFVQTSFEYLHEDSSASLGILFSIWLHHCELFLPIISLELWLELWLQHVATCVCCLSTFLLNTSKKSYSVFCVPIRQLRDHSVMSHKAPLHGPEHNQEQFSLPLLACYVL